MQITGQNSQVVLERSRPDNEVQVGDQFAPPAQQRTDLRKASHNGVVEIEDRERPQKPTVNSKLLIWVRRAEGAIIQLPDLSPD